MERGIVRSGDRQISFEQLSARAACAATGFASAPRADGGAVAVMLRNDIPFLECMLAANLAGAYCVPINWHYTAAEARYILEDSNATHLVVHSDLLAAIADAVPAGVVVIRVTTPPEIRAAYRLGSAESAPSSDVPEWDEWVRQWTPWPHPPMTLGTMTYTSGTTGRPKAVKRAPVPPDQREGYARLRAEWFGHRRGLRTAIVGPLYHSVQSTYAYSALRTGGCILLEPRFDAEQLLAIIDREKITHLHLVPTMMHRLARLPEATCKRYDVSSLEFVIHGAAPCPKDVKRRMIEWWGPIVHEYYGTSEAGMVCRSNSREWLEREGTVGRPWPGRTVRVYGHDGLVLPPLNEGLVYMSLGDMPDFVYHNSDGRRAEIARDGLLTNGDIGYVDEDGYLFLCDRHQDVVICGGVNIWPAEIEGVLATHPAVVDCAVFGIPHEEYGEVPAAAVQLTAHTLTSAEDLAAFVGARLAGFKVPRRFDVRDSLPRDDSGKLFKRMLRQPYWDAVGRRI